MSKIPADLHDILQSAEAMTKCMKKKCMTKAYREADKQLNEMIKEKMVALFDQLKDKKIDSATFAKLSKELLKEKLKIMKTTSEIMTYYECGLQSCEKEVERFRKLSRDAVNKTIQDADAFIRANKADKTNQVMVNLRKEIKTINKKRLKLLEKPFTLATFIEMSQQ